MSDERWTRNLKTRLWTKVEKIPIEWQNAMDDARRMEGEFNLEEMQ